MSRFGGATLNLGRGDKTLAGESAGDGFVGGAEWSDGPAVEGDFDGTGLAHLDDDLVFGGDGALEIGTEQLLNDGFAVSLNGDPGAFGCVKFYGEFAGDGCGGRF